MIITQIIVGLLLVSMIILFYRLYRESGPWRRQDWGVLALIVLWSVAVAVLARFIGAP